MFALQAPMLGVRSSSDAYLVESQMTGSERFLTGEWRYDRVENASHWLMLDQPEFVNSLLLN